MASKDSFDGSIMGFMYLLLISICSRLCASHSAFLYLGSLLGLRLGFLEIDSEMQSQGRKFIEDNSQVRG